MKDSELLEDKVTEAIYRAIDDVNLQLPLSSRLQKTSDTILFSREDGLDSLGLVNLIVALEKHMESSFGKEVSLSVADMLVEQESPFSNVRSLGYYVVSLLQND